MKIDGQVTFCKDSMIDSETGEVSMIRVFQAVNIINKDSSFSFTMCIMLHGFTKQIKELILKVKRPNGEIIHIGTKKANIPIGNSITNVKFTIPLIDLGILEFIVEADGKPLKLCGNTLLLADHLNTKNLVNNK